MEFESGKLLNAITNKSKSKKARIDIYMEGGFKSQVQRNRN